MNQRNVAAMDSAITAPNRHVETNGRRLAYRSIGVGQPLVLCTRFRGNMDAWDPGFLDALAAQGFQVITFDYSGLGLSTGEKNYDVAALANDARDLIEALDLHDAVIGGWSLGGLAAQIVVCMYPERISHAVLIGTGPPVINVKPPEKLFYDTAAIEAYSFEDEVMLFFEPASPASRAAARRSADRIARRSAAPSVPVPAGWAASHLHYDPETPVFPADAVLTALEGTDIPLLHVGGDHDIIFPVENWYALNGRLPTLQLLTYPRAGHGPQHEHPEATASHIAAFVRTTGRGDRRHGP